MSAYVEKFTAGMHTGLTALRDRLTSERTAKQTPFDANAKIFAAFTTLQEHTAQTDTALDALTSHSVEVAAT